jgi:transcriptional regulator with XRE-family HTH domain
MDVEAAFRKRLRTLVKEKFGSLDRFYLETDFSKGHLSNILRGKRNPSLSTLVRLAGVLEIEVRDLFIFPDRGLHDQALELIRDAGPEALRQVIKLLSQSASRR